MRSSLVVVVVAAQVAAVGGCGLLSDPPLPPAPPTPEAALQELEDAVFAQLACEERLRPSTLQRLRDVIDGADVDTVRALLLNPQDLARVVALGGAQVEAPVVVARNLFALVDSGAAHDLLAHGWDGLQCGEAQPLLCTAGGEAAVVDCDDDGAPSALRLSFDGCTLGGVVYDGDVGFARVDDDDGVAALSFGASAARPEGRALTIDEFRRLDGSLVVDVGAGAGRFVAAVTAPDVFEFFDHGGLASGLDCAAETVVTAVSVDVGDSDAVVALSASRKSPDVSVGIETFGDHLRFAGDCGCPQPGSGAFVDVPRPLGRAGETGRARVSWGDGGGDRCASVDVELVSWPDDCAGLDDLDGDCGKGATEATLEALFGALCGGG
jgi:hypothetical protein